MSFRSRFRAKFSDSSLYPLMRSNYRFISSNLFSFLRNAVESTGSLLGFRIIFPRYAVISVPVEKPTVVIRGFSGITYIGHKYYLSRKKIIRNYMDRPEVKFFVSDIYDISGYPVCPISILETVLIKEGAYKEKRIKPLRGATATHYVGNAQGQTVLVPMESSFFHFYIQVAPYILRNSESKRLLLNLDVNTSNLEVLQELGIPVEKLSGQFAAEKISRLAIQTGHYPSSSEIMLLREKLTELGYQRTSKRNFYLTRKGNVNGRRISNEKQLIDLLSQFDFEVVDPGTLSFKDQLRYFSQAKIVIAPHGAALSHLVNFPSSAIVLELNGDLDVRWHIRKMARHLGINHSLLLGTSFSDGTFLVNLEIVRKFLEKAAKGF